MIMGFVLIRLNSGIFISGFTGISASQLPLYLACAGLAVISIIVPESTGFPLKLLCIALLAGSGAFIFIAAGKKGRRTEKKLYIILMAAVLILCTAFNCISKLFMSPLDTDTRYIIFSSREDYELPEGDDSHHFISTGKLTFDSYYIDGIVIDSHELFLYYSDKTVNPTLTRFLSKESEASDDEINKADDLIVNALHGFSDKYDSTFFLYNDLVIHAECFSDHITAIDIHNMRSNSDRVSYDIDVAYTESDEEFVSDICIYLMTFPKGSEPWKYRIQSVRYNETIDGKPC